MVTPHGMSGGITDGSVMLVILVLFVRPSLAPYHSKSIMRQPV